MKSPTTHDISFKLNGSAHSFAAHQSSSSSSQYDKLKHYSNGKMYQNANKCSTSSQSSQSNGFYNHHHNLGSSSSSSQSNNDHPHNSFCDTNGSKEYTNGVDTPNGSQGSPLRSQLGLKLKKSNAPGSASKKSPNMCQVRVFVQFYYDIH